MKKRLITFLIFTLLSVSSHAQHTGLNQEQMQQLMQQAQQMQACMSRLDQKAMIAMSQRAQMMEAEIKTLCLSGKRDEAFEKAIRFGRTMANDEHIKIARECGEMTRGMLPTIDFPTNKDEAQGQHICDTYSR